MTQESGSVGSTFERFLEDEGFKEEVYEAAKKAVDAWLIANSATRPQAQDRQETTV
jgi:hypothetical protein